LEDFTMPTERVQIAFRGDDAGSCESANLAIAQAVAAGTLKNVSVMACGPALKQAVSLFKGVPGIDLGLHLTLNAEWVTVKWSPVLPAERVPTLLEPGSAYFTAAPRLLGESGFSVAEAVAEAEAQLALARSIGLEIAYMDEHMGVGGLPGFRPVLKALCDTEGILHLNSLNLMRLPTANNENLTDCWLSALQDASAGTYFLVTHPGRVAPDMQAFYEVGGTPGIIARERDAERHALADPALASGLERLGARSVRFSEFIG
jgi:predicted glycoside hydrolase/deacetylase ChbG (UPF0249 family)